MQAFVDALNELCAQHRVVLQAADNGESIDLFQLEPNETYAPFELLVADAEHPFLGSLI